MSASFDPEVVRIYAGRLEESRARLAERYPGEGGDRQPVHTVYGGAHLFKADTAPRLGGLALRALDAYSDGPQDLMRAAGLASKSSEDEAGERRHAEEIHHRVREKLEREPVEDFRIDFEDGYGTRSDDEEDGHAELAAAETAAGMERDSLPPFLGIRIKTLSGEPAARGLRTLDHYLTTLSQHTGGRLPGGFVVTLPKVTHWDQVELLAWTLGHLEDELGLAAGSVRVELMVETPQSIFDAGGMVALPRLVEAAAGRCRGAHFGTYDYTALMNVTASYQSMDHAACDFAKHVMQVSLAGTGVWLSDGATNVLPVPSHRGEGLGGSEAAENRSVVRAAWRLHAGHVRHSLVQGFYQGWDLHPAQLVTRYATLFDFFLRALDPAGERLRNFVDKAAQATLVGDVFDDAATGQGLLNYFLRAVNCGALSVEEAQRRSGLTLDELRLRSFAAILGQRRPG